MKKTKKKQRNKSEEDGNSGSNQFCEDFVSLFFHLLFLAVYSSSLRSVMAQFFGGFPFGGGFPGGEIPSMNRNKPPADTEKFYRVLGVDKKASTQEIKKAFRKLVATQHPDKGGDPEKVSSDCLSFLLLFFLLPLFVLLFVFLFFQFKEITKAHEVLSDPEKREIYDRGGEEALEAGGGDSRGDPTDILSAFFPGVGGMGGGGGGRRQKRGEDVVFPLKVSLEELYNGATKKLRLTKNAMCKGCEG